MKQPHLQCTIDGLQDAGAPTTATRPTLLWMAALALTMVACRAVITSSSPSFNYVSPAVASVQRPLAVGLAPRPAQPMVYRGIDSSIARGAELPAPSRPIFSANVGAQQDYLSGRLFAPLALFVTGMVMHYLWRANHQTSSEHWSMAAGFGTPVNKEKGKKGKGKGKKADAPPKSEDEKKCSCNSGEAYGSCCKPYHTFNARPSTAEALLRARYTALIKKQEDFIFRTYEPGMLTKRSMDVTKTCMDTMFFEELRILKEEAGEDESEVTFTSRMWYRYPGEKGLLTLTEKALYRLCSEVWVFVRTDEVSTETFNRGDTADKNTDEVLKAQDLSRKNERGRIGDMIAGLNAQTPTRAT